MRMKKLFNLNFNYWAITLIFSLTTFNACSSTIVRGDADVSQQQPTATSGQWTWVSGDNKTDQRGVYGTQGVAAGTNKPGARSDAVSWIDSEDNLWLFGGYGFAGKRITQYLNDLWKFDGANWTWVSGDNTGGEKGVYGAKGVAAATNKPGGRSGAASWIDSQGNLWIFGGYGNADHWYVQLLNDLWKFDGRQWTWISGDCIKDQPAVYGTRGVAESTNQPGARFGAVSWTDAAGNLWLFGGYGYDKYGAEGYLNDLWKFDGDNWVWVFGDSTSYEMGDYGSRGMVAGTNKPGARCDAVGWIDSGGNLWLFGGHGNANISWKVPNIYGYRLHIYGYRLPTATGAGYLNDLWKFDGTDWTWVSGDSKAFYSPQVVSETTEGPAARYGSVGWLDTTGNLWLFGGDAHVRFARASNDLWKFDGTHWIRIHGAVSHRDRQGVYGTRGVSADTNRPEARFGAVGWTDSEGTIWLFGGRKPLSARGYDYFNDLWKFEPQSGLISLD